MGLTGSATKLCSFWCGCAALHAGATASEGQTERLERHLGEGELQLKEAGAPVLDLHCHFATLLAIL